MASSRMRETPQEEFLAGALAFVLAVGFVLWILFLAPHIPHLEDDDYDGHFNLLVSRLKYCYGDFSAALTSDREDHRQYCLSLLRHTREAYKATGELPPRYSEALNQVPYFRRKAKRFHVHLCSIGVHRHCDVLEEVAGRRITDSGDAFRAYSAGDDRVRWRPTIINEAPPAPPQTLRTRAAKPLGKLKID